MNSKKKLRTVLVMLTNRLNRNQKPKFVELRCRSNGAILRERVLRGKPRKAIYDEVWNNDEGKKSLDTCTRMIRLYNHPLERKAD